MYTTETEYSIFTANLMVSDPDYFADVFAKAGAIVPMNVLRPHDNKLLKSESMEIFVFPGASNSFKVFEDDGDSYEYTKGKIAETLMTLDYTDKKAVFEINATQGDLAQTVKGRSYILSFRGFNRNTRVSVTVNGVKKNVRREYDKASNTLKVYIPKTAVTSSIKAELTAKNLMHDNSDKYERMFEIILRSQIDYQQKADYWDAVKRHKDSDIDIINYLVTYNGSKKVVEALMEQLIM